MLNENWKIQILRLTGTSTLIISLLVMAGWLLHLNLLTRLIDGWPTMKFNTALLFALISLSTVLITYSRANPVLFKSLIFLSIFF
ncbi:MAG: hypothetical protein LPK45_10065, partial [Bacteroidota bacterium]|nr:hypothetical protein [Bacteroidota bacterium]MDX5431437.1 hypothetical protein [Bacteroidota bacterium]MDX5470165.1 hypothetical protein [Bacteroidota bacterium]